MDSVDKQPSDTDKADWFFYFLVLLIAIYIFIKTVPWPVEKNIDVLVLQQKKAIENIYSPIDSHMTAEFLIDTIHFPESEYLYHHNFGYSEFKSDFFLKIQTQMKVHKAGTFYFSIRSDDGFILLVDNQEICKHPTGRPMGESLCSAELTKATHHFEIFYYQGFGYLGLEAKYELGYDSNKQLKQTSEAQDMTIRHSMNMHFIGRNSDEVSFYPMPVEQRYVNQ